MPPRRHLPLIPPTGASSHRFRRHVDAGASHRVRSRRRSECRPPLAPPRARYAWEIRWSGLNCSPRPSKFPAKKSRRRLGSCCALPKEFLRRLPAELARCGANGVRPAPARVRGGRSCAERPTEPTSRLQTDKPSGGALQALFEPGNAGEFARVLCAGRARFDRRRRAQRGSDRHA